MKNKVKNILPKVILIGRANVGKSTLFNKIIEQQKAIVSPIAGTTRDINTANAYWNGINFSLMDSGGIDKIISSRKLKTLAPEENQDFAIDIINRTQKALKEADIFLFVVDNTVGIQPEDRELAKQLLVYNKPVFLVVNKVDKMKDVTETSQFHGLGYEMLYPVSGYTSIGIGDLLDAITNLLVKEKLGQKEEKFKKNNGILVTLVGRPNVGKSSLFNKLIGDEKAIVSDIAHTTREPNDYTLTYDDQIVTFIDTAGIRRKSKVSRGIEEASVSKTIEASHKAEVVLFVLDVSEPFTMQDKSLAEILISSNSSVLIVANKYDLIKEKSTNIQAKLSQEIYRTFPFLTWAPITFTSAKSGQHVDKIYQKIFALHDKRSQTIPKEELDLFIERVVARHKPAAGKGMRRPQIRDFIQTETNPPKFQIRIRPTDQLAAHYIRFIENQLREKYGFEGVRLWISVKK